jgi:hypothetical protein
MIFNHLTAHIETRPIEAYIRQYGWRGWFSGLEDNRQLTAAAVMAGEGQERFTLDAILVKDAFYYYYLEQPWASARHEWTRAKHRADRDRDIAEAIADIKSREGKAK